MLCISIAPRPPWDPSAPCTNRPVPPPCSEGTRSPTEGFGVGEGWWGLRQVPVWELELGTAAEGDGDGSASGGHSQHPQHVWVLGSAQPPRWHRQAPCYKGREVLWSRGVENARP